MWNCTPNGEIKRKIRVEYAQCEILQRASIMTYRIQTTDHSTHTKCFQQYQTRNRLTNLPSFKAPSVTTTEIMRVAIVCCYRPWWFNITYTGRPSFFWMLRGAS